MICTGPAIAIDDLTKVGGNRQFDWRFDHAWHAQLDVACKHSQTQHAEAQVAGNRHVHWRFALKRNRHWQWRFALKKNLLLYTSPPFHSKCSPLLPLRSSLVPHPSLQCLFLFLLGPSSLIAVLVLPATSFLFLLLSVHALSSSW